MIYFLPESKIYKEILLETLNIRHLWFSCKALTHLWINLLLGCIVSAQLETIIMGMVFKKQRGARLAARLWHCPFKCLQILSNENRRKLTFHFSSGKSKLVIFNWFPVSWWSSFIIKIVLIALEGYKYD
jgi:hypothetical protein